MSLYAKYVVPRLIDFGMRHKSAAQIRSELIPLAQGTVLEVGIGSGLNLPFYSASASRIYGVDPSHELLNMARKRVNESCVPVELVAQSAEEKLPLEEHSVDTVVITWSLCSMRDPLMALRQVRRVLRSTGQLLFVEHGLAPDARVRAWQNRINPVWRRIGGGCNLNRKIDDLVRSAGFEITELKAAYLPGPRPLTYTYQGLAR
jgi:ubiquinone/menaquinone biosynthesis C-methylase UbiE